MGNQEKWWEIPAVLLIVGILALMVVICQNASIDESNFLYAANKFYAGQVPYRDFFFDKLPTLLIIYGLPQKLFAPGLLVGRLTASFFFLGSLLLIMLTANKLLQRRAAVIAGLIFGAKLFNLTGTCLVFTYAPALFFFCLSLYFFFSKPFRYRWLMVILCWSLATQIRQFYLVTLPFMLLYEYKKNKEPLAGLLVKSITVTILSVLYLIPIFYLGRENAFYDLVTIYLTSHADINASFWAGKLHWFQSTLRIYIPEITLALLLLTNNLFGTDKNKRRFLTGSVETLLAAMMLMLIAVSLRSYYSYAIHNIIVAPLLTLLLTLPLARLAEKEPRKALVFLSLFSVLLIVHGYPYVKRYWNIGLEYQKTINTLRQELVTRTRPQDKILSFNHFLLAESERDAVEGVTYSFLSIFPKYSREKCQSLHLVNPAMLFELVSEKRPRLIEINSIISVHLKQTFGAAWHKRFLDEIRKNYQLTFTLPNIQNQGGNFYLFERL